MTRTGDQSFIKVLNQSIVLNVVRFSGPISRTQIARRTGLNKATISSLIEELINKQLVVELGPGPAQMGRRPILLHFNAEAGFVIGIDLGINSARFLVTDLSGHPINRHIISWERENKPDHLIGELIQEIRALAQSLPDSPYGVIGIGVGVPGLVDYRRGIVINAPNLRWQNVHLKTLLENNLHLPVYVDNDANTGALGEKFRGAGRLVSNLVYVSVSVGIGTGIVQGNELLRGAHGFAGEFGHMTINPNGPLCSCGNRGCLETYASEQFLLNKYQRLSGQKLTFHEILSKAQNGDPTAVECFQKTGINLGIGIANILSGLNPSLILIGNRMQEAGNLILEPVLQAVQSHCFIAPYAPLDIRLSELGADASPVGAAFLVLSEHFAGPYGRQNITSDQQA